MTKSIPEGYTAVTPFLIIDGAADAIEFYKMAFDARERGRVPGPDGKLMHAEISIGGAIIMLSDPMMGAPTQSNIHLYVQDADALWARATRAGAQVVMPIGDMFWGDRYGVVADRWGNRWSIATHKEDMTPEEMQKRQQQAIKQMAEQGPC